MTVSSLVVSVVVATVVILCVVMFLRADGAVRVLLRVAAFAKSQTTNKEANTATAVMNFEKNLLFFFIYYCPFYFNRSHAVS